MLFFLSWINTLITSTQHLEMSIFKLFESSQQNNLHPINGIYLINDPSFSSKILSHKMFNRKGKDPSLLLKMEGIYDSVYGAYSFRPFTLQQLLNDDDWERSRICNACLGLEGIGSWDHLILQTKSLSNLFINNHFQTLKNVDLLNTLRKLVCKIVCVTTFGFDIDEHHLTRIIKGVQDIDEYVKRVSIGDMQNRRNMRDSVKACLQLLYNKPNIENSFVSVLLSMRKKEDINLSEEEIVNYICSVLITSFTIQVTDLVNHVIAVLNEFPHIQDNLFKEITSEDISLSNTQRGNSYLQKVIDETMRLYPLNPLLSRVSTDDVQLGDLHFKKGDEAIISCPAIHRMGWKNPEVFDPERFDKSSNEKGCYIPFGLGPRICPAGKIGVVVAKTILVTLLYNLNFSVHKGFKHERSLWYGVPCTVSLRGEQVTQGTIDSFSHWKKQVKHFILSKFMPVSAWVVTTAEKYLPLGKFFLQ